MTNPDDSRCLADPVGRLAGFLDGGGKRTIIALAGYPGSGKSTITRVWEAELSALRGEGALVVLGMDGFHLTRAQLSAMDDPEEAFARRGAPYTFDPAGFVAKMTELRRSAGRAAVGWPGFEHAVGDPAPDAVVVPAQSRLILVEGIYTLYRGDGWGGLAGLFDEEWFLDTPLETSMERLYVRHQEAWGMSEAEARARADGNDRLNCTVIAPTRDRADFLVI